MPESTDILILGAGPAGTATAMFLARAGIAVTIAEKDAFPRDKVCGDALSGKVTEILRKLDPDILPRLHAQPEHLGSWGLTFVAPNLKEVQIPFKVDYDPSTSTPPGYIAKRIHFDHFMVKEMMRYPQITLLENCNFTSFERMNDGWLCKSADGREIRTKLVIDCSGALSRFARQVAGMKKEPAHYSGGIRAYYRNVSGLDKDNFIELHFLKDFLPGYLWIFPLANGYANVGVGMRSDIISKKKINLEKEMLRIIEEHPHIRERFKNATLEGKILGFPLPMGSKKRSLSGDGYLLTGDAGSLIDPFTGEGIGNALVSGMFAAQWAAKAVEAGRFDAQFLSGYDGDVYRRLWSELKISRTLQRLVRFPWLFNLVVNKARKNKVLRETISCMLEDVDLRSRLRKPSFYFKLLFSNG